jgi:hypothetical protein
MNQTIRSFLVSMEAKFSNEYKF